MNTSFHFASAQEITPDIVDVIRRAYQEKPVFIHIQEDEIFVPEWQMLEVRRRDAIIEKNPAIMIDCDMVINELEKELEIV
jgi:hypothetical protein